MMNWRPKRNTYEASVKFNQQTSIRTIAFSHYLRIFICRIRRIKRGWQLANIKIIFHFFHHRTGKWSLPKAASSIIIFFARSIFILPMCRNRHTSPSLGQFLFYRRVGTVTRHLMRSKNISVLCIWIISHNVLYVNILYVFMFNVNKILLYQNQLSRNRTYSQGKIYLNQLNYPHKKSYKQEKIYCLQKIYKKTVVIIMNLWYNKE